MISRLPSVRITPENVIAFCKKRGQKPTEDEAEVWLSRHRKTIEEILKSVIEKELDQILNEAALEEYPDPAFDRQWRLIDDAVMAASDDYAQKIGKEHYGSSHTEAELLEVVRRMLLENESFSVCVAYQQEFGEPFKDFNDRVVTHQTRRVHIKREDGHLTVELVETDNCDHDHDTFMPEKLHKFQ